MTNSQQQLQQLILLLHLITNYTEKLRQSCITTTNLKSFKTTSEGGGEEERERGRGLGGGERGTGERRGGEGRTVTQFQQL